MDKKREELLRSRNWSEKEKDSARSPAEPGSYETQCHDFNARVHQELAAIPVPPTLRDQILARRKIIVVPFWKKPAAIAAMAAAFLILTTGLLFWNQVRTEDQTFAGFRARMVGFALREYRMDIHTQQLLEVQKFLAQNGAPSQFNLPAAMAATPVKGGAKLSWQGKPVGMICFTGAGGETLYMFIIESALAAHPAPAVAAFKSLSTAAWTSDGKTFLVAAPLPAAELEKLVKT